MLLSNHHTNHVRKIFLLFALCCIGAGICIEAYANQKRPKNISVHLEKKMTAKGPRSASQPIEAVFSADGNAITLHSPENCDRAFATISGSGNCITDMVNFTDRTAMLDVSDLDCGGYLLTVEYENGTIYTGQIEFIE